jgi:hypothetical protein
MVGETCAGSATPSLCVVCGFEERVAGADVWGGIPESRVGSGFAAGWVTVAGNAGVAIASAGCKAFGADRLGQNHHAKTTPTGKYSRSKSPPYQAPHDAHAGSNARASGGTAMIGAYGAVLAHEKGAI